MRSRERLRHLEEMMFDRWLLREAERMAKEHGLDTQVVFRQCKETVERVERWGWEAELRRLAREFGVSDEQVRADYEAALMEGEQG